MSTNLRIGFIPLIDAAALLVAVEHGFAAAEGLDITLVREVSWSNVRDKLNIGLLDAAHMLSPMAIASTLGIGHIRVSLIAPFNLGMNGNAITVSDSLYAAIAAKADGDVADPAASARALASVVAERKAAGLEGTKLLLVQPVDEHGAAVGDIQAAVDRVQAGVGDLVYLVGSREAALACDPWFVPVDAAIVGIVDGVDAPKADA